MPAPRAPMRQRSSARHVRPEEPTATELSLKAVQTSRVYESVVSQLQHLVTSGQLRPGDKLPSERELCRRFEVGRSSIRDALRVLQTMGVVRSRHGGGTVVQDLSPETIVTPLAMLLTRKGALIEELMDVRAIVEPPLAARAALNASDEDLERLRALVGLQEKRTRRGELSVVEDEEFHAIIARSAGNRVMRSVVDVLLDLLHETRTQALQGKARSVRSAIAHRRILRALESRSPDAAEKAMRDHVVGIHEILARHVRAGRRRGEGEASVPAAAAAPRAKGRAARSRPAPRKPPSGRGRPRPR